MVFCEHSNKPSGYKTMANFLTEYNKYVFGLPRKKRLPREVSVGYSLSTYVFSEFLFRTFSRVYNPKANLHHHQSAKLLLCLLLNIKTVLQSNHILYN